jgi:hypothetical protein
VAHYLSFPSAVCLLFLILVLKSDGTEPPSPPRSPTTFLFTFQSSDLVLFGGVLLEALGGSSIQRVLSILSTRLGRSRGCRDLLRQRMFGEYWFWGFIPVQVAIDYPIFGIVFHYSKLFFLKSPYHNRIVWNIRFDLLVVRLAGSKDPNLLLFRILVAVDGLEIFWIVIKLCVVWCYVCWAVCCCFSCVCFSCCCVVSAAFLVGYFAVTNVTFSALFVGFFSALFVGFCIPLCRVM